MSSVIARARTRLVVILLAAAAVIPLALAAAQYPSYWVWIALELTPMTWVQTVVLMLAAGAAALTAVAGSVRGWTRMERAPYWLLSFGFAYLAFDDRFAVHERIRDRYLAPRDVGIPGLSFLAPGDVQMLLTGLAGLLVLPLVLRALRRDRLALSLFVLGALAAVASLGMDAIDPAAMPLDVERLAQTLEECVELLAAALFLAALGVRLLALLEPVRADATPLAGAPDVRPGEPEPEPAPAQEPAAEPEPRAPGGVADGLDEGTASTTLPLRVPSRS